MVSVEIEQLTFAYGTRPVLNRIDLHLSPMIIAIVGPNAVGKTTLLKCIGGVLKPQGRILVDGQDICTGKRTPLVGYLEQEALPQAALTVLETVLLGRLHTLSWRVGDDDLAVAFVTLAELGIAGLALRPLGELSGGQRQMVAIAQALVQEPAILALDEPTNSLDLQHQLEMLALIRRITDERQLVTLLALHDLNLAARHADRVVVLHRGQVYDDGSPRAVLTAEMIRAVYGVRAGVHFDEEGTPLITPLASLRKRGRNSRS